MNVREENDKKRKIVRNSGKEHILSKGRCQYKVWKHSTLRTAYTERFIRIEGSQNRWINTSTPQYAFMEQRLIN
jgi:hypothetical protein